MELSEKDIQLIEVQRVLSEYKVRFNELIKKKIQDEDLIATGNLLASIHTEIDPGDGYIYKVQLNSLAYIKYLEEGTGPGHIPDKRKKYWPNGDAILSWVRDKKLPTAEYTGEKSLPTEKQLAYLVGRKIYNEGTEAKQIIANTVEELNRQYLPLLIRALEMDFTRELPIINLRLQFQ